MTITTVVRVSRCILFLQGEALSMLLSLGETVSCATSWNALLVVRLSICVAE